MRSGHLFAESGAPQQEASCGIASPRALMWRRRALAQGTRSASFIFIKSGTSGLARGTFDRPGFSGRTGGPKRLSNAGNSHDPQRVRAGGPRRTLAWKGLILAQRVRARQRRGCLTLLQAAGAAQSAWVTLAHMFSFPKARGAPEMTIWTKALTALCPKAGVGTSALCF